MSLAQLSPSLFLLLADTSQGTLTSWATPPQTFRRKTWISGQFQLQYMTEVIPSGLEIDESKIFFNIAIISICGSAPMLLCWELFWLDHCSDQFNFNIPFTAFQRGRALHVRASSLPCIYPHSNWSWSFSLSEAGVSKEPPHTSLAMASILTPTNQWSENREIEILPFSYHCENGKVNFHIIMKCR